MLKWANYFNSSIGRKQVMALSAFFLVVFAIFHLSINLIFFFGQQTFNRIANLLADYPLIPVAEIGLLAVFLVHILLGVKLVAENYMARGEKRYILKVRTGLGATFASRTMPYTGFVILTFLIIHLINLKYGHTRIFTYQAIQMRDLYGLIVEFFKIPNNTIGYILAMSALSYHLVHGIQSILQSIGLIHQTYTPLAKIGSFLLAVILGLSFSAIPLWAYFKGAV